MWSLLAAVATAVIPAAAPVVSWVWPLPAPHQVLAGFDPPAHDWLPGHRGVDLAAHPGEVVVAAGAGRISYAGTIAGVGVVAIRHAGGLETTYEPVAHSVHVGEVVRVGQPIGRIAGRLGHCLQVCLHWGLLHGGLLSGGLLNGGLSHGGRTYLDPLTLVGGVRIRLLPTLSPAARPPPTGGAWAVPAAAAGLLGFRRVRRRCPLAPPKRALSSHSAISRVSR